MSLWALRTHPQKWSCQKYSEERIPNSACCPLRLPACTAGAPPPQLASSPLIFRPYSPSLQKAPAPEWALYTPWQLTGGRGTLHFWVSGDSMPSHGAMGNWTVLHIQDSCMHPFGLPGIPRPPNRVSPHLQRSRAPVSQSSLPTPL